MTSSDDIGARAVALVANGTVESITHLVDNGEYAGYRADFLNGDHITAPTLTELVERIENNRSHRYV